MFSAGHDLREIIDATDAERESLFALCSQTMQTIRDSVAAGDRPGARAGHRRRLPVGGHLRPGRRRRRSQLRHAWHQDRPVLFDAGRGRCRAPSAPKKAMEMLLTAEPVPAREAERIGLVNRVVPREQLAEATLELARQIAAASPYTLGLGKRGFYEQLELDVPQAYQVTERIMVENAQAPDAIEGMKAFLERRPPKWGGS